MLNVKKNHDFFFNSSLLLLNYLFILFSLCNLPKKY